MFLSNSSSRDPCTGKRGINVTKANTALDFSKQTCLINFLSMCFYCIIIIIIIIIVGEKIKSKLYHKCIVHTVLLNRKKDRLWKLFPVIMSRLLKKNEMKWKWRFVEMDPWTWALKGVQKCSEIICELQLVFNHSVMQKLSIIMEKKYPRWISKE